MELNPTLLRDYLTQEILCTAEGASNHTFTGQFNIPTTVLTRLQVAQFGGLRRIERAFIPIDVTAKDLLYPN